MGSLSPCRHDNDIRPLKPKRPTPIEHGRFRYSRSFSIIARFETLLGLFFNGSTRFRRYLSTIRGNRLTELLSQNIKKVKWGTFGSIIKSNASQKDIKTGWSSDSHGYLIFLIFPKKMGLKMKALELLGFQPTDFSLGAIGNFISF